VVAAQGLADAGLPPAGAAGQAPTPAQSSAMEKPTKKPDLDADHTAVDEDEADRSRIRLRLINSMRGN
jgi:hypothetical protein